MMKYCFLGYSSEWIKYGIITESDIINQISVFKDSDDKNREHYRHHAFQKYLENKTILSDSEIDNIFSLEDFGEDGCCLKTQRIAALLHSDILNRDQRLALSKYDAMNEDPVNKIYKRKLFLSKLSEHGFSEKIFDIIKESEDLYIQERAFGINELSKEQYLWLYENGLSKKIRNMAKNRLNSREFRS